MVGAEMYKVSRQSPSDVARQNSGAHEGIHESEEGVSEKNQLNHRLLRRCPRLRMFLLECRNFLSRT